MTTVNQTKHDAKMEILSNIIVYLKLLTWIIIMNALQPSFVKGFPPIQNSKSDQTISPASSCGGNFIASCIGQLIELPKYNPNESTYCEWTITAPNPKLVIGLSYVGVNFNFWIDNNMELDIYDGPFPSVNTPKLSSLDGTDDLISLFTRIESSSSHKVFFNLTSSPNGFQNYRLEFSIAFYICGGTITNPMVIDSPRFNSTGQDNLVPTSVRCVWKINRPEHYLYGHIRIHELDTSTCDVVTITVVGGRLGCANDCYINATDTTASLNATHLGSSGAGMLSDQMSDLSVAQNNEQTIQNQTLALCKYYNVVDLAFSGVYAVLTYEVFFNGTYVANHFQMYGPIGLGRSSKKPISIPWYFNFAPVAIYVPVGLIFGFLIIFLQVKPRKLVMRTRVSISSLDNAFRNSSVGSDVPMAPIIKTNKEDEKNKGAKFTSSKDEGLIECKAENNNIGSTPKPPVCKKVHFG